MKGRLSRDITLWIGLTIVAVAFQLAPVYIGGVGYLFNLLVSLLMILAASMSLGRSVLMLIAGTGLLAIIEPREAAVFFFMTAPVGISIAVGLSYMKGILFNTLTGGMLLFIGMTLCGYGLDISFMGWGFQSLDIYMSLPLIALLSFAYSGLLSICSSWLSRRVLFFHANTE